MLTLGILASSHSIIGPSDPNYSSVQLLLHGDGTNGGTIITDNSPHIYTLARQGDTNTSTAQFKYGTASILFDGNGDYLSLDSSGGFGLNSANDFTIEGWVYLLSIPDTTNNVSTIIGLGSGTVSGSNTIRSLSVFFTGGTFKLGYFIGGSGAGATISQNTWYHYAISRNSGSSQFYLNGTAVGAPVSDTIASVDNLTIGADIATRTANTSFKFNGYLDDLRITKGVGRYTGAFTPPTAAYPNM